MINDPFLKIIIVLFLYYITLWILRIFNIGRKKSCEHCNNCCPDCTNPLHRIKRTYNDKLFIYFTFMIFNFRRYACNECGWEGLRWEKNFSLNNK